MPAAAVLLLTLEDTATGLMTSLSSMRIFDRRIALGITCLIAGAVVARHGSDTIIK